jgi:hypothetical protein
MATFDKEFWYRLVDGALPARKLELDREAVVHSIVDCLGEWALLNLGPHVERVREVSVLFEQWQRVTEKVGVSLEKLGIADSRGRYQAESDAFVIYSRAIEGLRRWQRLYRPTDRETLSATLVKNLRTLCCGRDPDDPEHRNGREHGVGITEAELEILLQRIVDSGRLPSLDLKGILKRKEPGRSGVATRMRSR